MLGLALNDRARPAIVHSSLAPITTAAMMHDVALTEAQSLSHALLRLVLILLPLPPASGAATACKPIPGDPSWPTPQDWSQLNRSIHGRLIATVPLASICHASPYQDYDATLCSSLGPIWADAHTHYGQPSEMIAPWFQNQSCDPFTPASRPCELGNYASYGINISCASDVQAGLSFAREHNVRVVVKNTGHDYLGKSSGAGGLALWTHHLNTTEVIEEYDAPYYSGPAIRMRAGVQGAHALLEAAARGYRIVGGECADVGLAGGYSQGGGHSVLGSVHGMGADNVLEWEVVTGDGAHVVATPEQNEDLYWALCGGGGGTYGVVLSMTSRLHADGPYGSAKLDFNASSISVVHGSRTGSQEDVFWDAAGVLLGDFLPRFEADGNSMIFSFNGSTFSAFSIDVPNPSPNFTTPAQAADHAIAPFLGALSDRGIPYTYSSSSYNTYLDAYVANWGPLPYGPIEAGNEIISSRLVPRSLASDPSTRTAITSSLRAAATIGYPDFLVTVVAMSPPLSARVAPNAVLPAWRHAVADVTVVGDWDFTAEWAVNAERQDRLMERIMPKIVEATPGSGSYLNEDNFALEAWQESFYGENWDRLKEVKDRYDPEGLLVVRTGVGSEVWTEDGSARLCPVEA